MKHLLSIFIFLFIVSSIFTFSTQSAKAEVFPGCTAAGESVCNIIDAVNNFCYDACRTLVSDCCNSTTFSEYSICFNDLTGAISDVDRFCSSILFGIKKPSAIPSGGPSSFNETLDLIQKLAGWLFAFTIIIAVIAIIIAGLIYIIAGGSTDRAKIASRMLIYSAIGFVVAGLAWTIISLINSALF